MLIQTVTIPDDQRPVHYCKYFSLKRIILLVDKVIKEGLKRRFVYCKMPAFMIGCKVSVIENKN